jgi:diguanylate cyclase (GGDEF)-like protein/PAS domain S-box-containing protein
MNKNLLENQIFPQKNLETLDTLRNQLQYNQSFLQLLLDTIPNPVFYKDINGIYQHCNDSFSKMIIGVEKELIIGKSLYDLPEYIPTELADIYSNKDQELFSNPGTQFYEAKVKCADKKLRYFNFYKATYMSEENEVLGLVGVMLDVTTYKNIQIELEKKNLELKKLSIVDELTNLYNRRYFEEMFQKKIEKLNREKKPFCFAIIDVDYFKDYNDGFGHLKGDETLKKISLILKKTFNRANDYQFRLGGEEFGILFDVDKVENAIKIIKKLIENISSEKIETYNQSVSDFLTVSIGLGFIENIDLNNQNFKDELYDRIDRKLYESKKGGRNRFSLEII